MASGLAIITDRTIGLELELVIPIVGEGTNLDVQRLIADILTRQGISACARPYSQQPVPEGHLFCVEHDSSLRDETRFAGIRWAKLEVKGKPMQWPEMERVVPGALEILQYLGCRVNTSTGLHVHHHLPEIIETPQVARNLAHLWFRIHKVVYGLLPPSRCNNQYCWPPQLSDASRFDRIKSYGALCQELNRCDRYQGLNFTNLTNRQRLTVEWRAHSGSLDWAKIRAWILATQRWTEHALGRSCHLKAGPLPNTRPGLNALLLSTGLKPNSRIYQKVQPELRAVGRYLLKRWKQVNQPSRSA